MTDASKTAGVAEDAAMPPDVATIPNDSREAFELFVQSELGFVPFDLSKSNGRYWNDSINRQWEAWQSALAWVDTADTADNAALSKSNDFLAARQAAETKGEKGMTLLEACQQAVSIEFIGPRQSYVGSYSAEELLTELLANAKLQVELNDANARIRQLVAENAAIAQASLREGEK